MITDPLFYAAAIPAVTMLGLGKGGFAGLGLLSLPLMALVVSPVQAAAITLPILIVQDVVSVWAYRYTWDMRNVVLLVLGGLSGVITGYLLAAKVSDGAIELAVGVISVTFAIRRLLLERGPVAPDPVPSTTPRGLFWGWVTGFTSMIAHAGGPPFQIYVMPQKLPRDVFVGTGSVVFAIINWIKVPPYLALGQFTAENMATAGALIPLAIASTWAGVLLVRRVSGQSFYTAVYVLLIFVGGKLIYDGARALL